MEKGSPEDPSLAALLERIALLERKLTRFGDCLYSLSQDFMDHRKAQSDRFDRAFERIKNLEVSVFPNLLDDIERLHQIIGGDGPRDEKNPLDSRNSSPSNNDAAKPNPG